jgi:hypothetical protein
VYIWCSIPKDRTPKKRKYSIRKTYGTVLLIKTSEDDNQATVPTDLVSEEAPIRNPDQGLNN